MTWKERARQLRTEVHALVLALRHPRTPWHAKLLAAVVIAYAASPIDLIPDFIPVLGLVDDLVLVPLGIALVIRLVPPEVYAECRARAAAAGPLPGGRLAAAAILALWLLLLAAAVRLLWR